MTIFDIGANLGFCSLYFKSRFPDSVIYCFEPVPVNFDYLTKNLRRNPNQAVIPIHAGIASRHGTLTLYSGCDDDFPTDSSAIAANGTGTSFTIDTVRLEDVLDEYEITKIDLLKVDCEGAEYDLFYNSRQDVFDIVENVVMEVHHGDGENENIAAICEHLGKLGFHYCVAEDALFLWASKDKDRLKEVTVP
jgi:FkbM family methyltransferase